MRRPDWKHELRAEIEAAAGRPFSYDSRAAHDCCQFPARCVLAMTGVDHAARFESYVGARAAYRLARRHGGLEGIASGILGPPVAPNLLREGDVALAELEVRGSCRRRPTLGICEGHTVAFAAGQGVVRRRRDVIRLGWRVD